MSKEINIKDVKIGGLRQNCYALDTLPAINATKKTPQAFYPSLEKKNLPNGYIQEIEMKSYPINSETVTSYADGADYRRDPMQAIANAPKRTNLGDVREVQEFINTDPQKAVLQYKEIINQVTKYLESAQKKVEHQAQTQIQTDTEVNQ